MIAIAEEGDMVFLQRFFVDLFVNLTPGRGVSIVIDVALTSIPLSTPS